MKNTKKLWLFLLPSILGMVVFYFTPSAIAIRYAFTNTRGEFVFFSNFADVFGNFTFRLAAGNSLRFILYSVPINVILSFALALILQGLRYKKLLSIAFMLPLIIPSSAVVFFWNILFADNGAINSILFRLGIDTVPWLMSDMSFWVILLVFLFRNIGFNMVLYLSGLQLIPSYYYEVVRVEGGGTIAALRHITLVYIMPTTFLVFMMSIINSFRIFREIYLLYGPYPHQSVYMLQHFMNNQFVFANMQRLAVTSATISAITIIFVWGIFTGQRKISDNFV